MGLVFPAVLHYTRSKAHYGKSELALSRFSSCVMLVIYAAYLFYQLKNQTAICNPVENESQGREDDNEAPEITKLEAIIWLAIVSTWISVLFEYLVGAIEGASHAWGIPVAFISIILLPIVGNTAEHASAIVYAMKDKLIPFCVVIAWMMGKPLD